MSARPATHRVMAPTNGISVVQNLDLHFVHNFHTFLRQLPFAAAGRIGIAVMGSLKGGFEKLKS
jgi:hypothetical protein